MKRKKKIDFNLKFQLLPTLLQTEKFWFDPLRINPFDLKSFRTPDNCDMYFRMN